MSDTAPESAVEPPEVVLPTSPLPPPPDEVAVTRRPPRRAGGPGKRTIDRPKWNALLTAFRRRGPNFNLVADDCSVHWNTAKRAWHKGWADQKDKEWAIPIKNKLEEEKIEARAALEREKNDLVNDHRIGRQQQLMEAIEEGFSDLIDSRKKQGKVIRAARDNSIAALIISRKLLQAAVPLADLIATQLHDPALTVFERMRLMRQIVRFGTDAVEISQIADDMERKALGEPDAILQVQHGMTMDLSEAKATLAEIASVLALHESSDIEDVIDTEWATHDPDTDEIEVPVTSQDRHPAG